jgi:hypothetical protein
MKLHNIGKKIVRLKTDRQRGLEPYKLAGSNKLPTYVVDKPVRAPKITRAPFPTDARFDTAGYEEHFSAYLPGIDPATGKPWK